MERIWLRPKNKLSKKQLGFWERYVWAWNKFGSRTLFDCYKNPSGSKEYAWRALTNRARQMGATNICLCGYSVQRFTIGYIVPSKGVFTYETAENTYHIELEEVSGNGWKPTDGDDIRNFYPKLMTVVD